MMSCVWGDLTSEELAAAAADNAQVLVPLGCTEQHAGHLPVDTDSYQVERLAREGAAKAAAHYGLKVLVLPTLPFGPASEHAGYSGTISLTNELYVQLVKQILRSVVDGGFSRIATLRGCGGHWAVPGIIWDIKAEMRRAGKSVTLRDLHGADDRRVLTRKHFPAADQSHSGHAGVMETALCLADRAHLVRTERMQAPELNLLWERYRDGGEAFLFDEVSSTGALGAADLATAEGGRRLWDDLTSALCERLKFIDDQDQHLGRLSNGHVTDAARS